MSGYVNTTTGTPKTRHLSRSEDLKPRRGAPGHFGRSLCGTRRGVVDQVYLDDFALRNWCRKYVVINELPLCKHCARKAEVPQ